jgi:hypothetical protein
MAQIGVPLPLFSLFFDKKWKRVGHVAIRELRKDVQGLFSVNF